MGDTGTVRIERSPADVLRLVVAAAGAVALAVVEWLFGDTLVAFGTDLLRGLDAVPQWMVDHQQEFTMQPGETLAGILARYEQVAARTAEVVAALPDLSATHPLPEAPWHEAGERRSVRRVLLGVVAETAQHAGHADILRESIDGQKTMG